MGRTIEVWSQAASLAVRQALIQQQRLQYTDGNNCRHNQLQRPSENSARPAFSANPISFFDAPKPKMDILDFTAAVLQQYPALRVFFRQNFLQQLALRNQQAAKSWIA